MKFLKNNVKVIIAFIIGVLLASGIVYAATSASQVTYATEKNAEIQNVDDALNDLYEKLNNNLELGQVSFEIYRGDRKNISVTKKVDTGRYLVAVSRTLGSTSTSSYSVDSDEDNSSEFVCDKNCDVKKISNKNIVNSSSSKNNSTYTYYDNFLGLYEISVKENDTTITYNYTISSASTVALGCILEVIKIN